MLAPGTQIGSYAITAFIGAGAMGEVYRARDVNLKREVALKILPRSLAADPARLARFRREAELLAMLDHPHIAGIYGFEQSGDITALSLQLVDVETLADRLARGAMPVDEALRTAGQIADALAAAHAQGVIHRDLKPSNIGIAHDGDVKVLDFGLAKLAEPTKERGQAPAISLSPTMTSPAVITGAGMLLGTAAYMSPEQATGKSVDKRTDVWAFGCVLYEMLTGRRLHKGDTVSETIAAVLKDSPDLSSVPSHLRRLLRGCLQKDPERRLRDIADWQLLLDDVDTGATARSSGGWRWMWPALVTVVLLAATALGWVLLRQPQPAVQELQSQIPAPEGLTFNPGTQATISPDARWLAFVAAGPDNISRMYIRSLSSLEVRPLPGSEGIVPLSPPPFWSYDSRYVVYGALGTLKKSEVSGTPAQTITDTGLQFVQGGSWNQNGVILYGRAGGGLAQVSADGGTPSPVTALQPQETAHRYPQFLPDGRRFLYLRVSGSPDRTGVFVGSLDAKPEDQSTTMLLPTNRQAWWVLSEKTGLAYLVMQREDTLLAQPFDPETATLSGTPVPVASGVGSWAAANSGLWSVARYGALTYRTGGTGLPQLTWLDLRGGEVGTVGEPGLLGTSTLSPDGTRVAYRFSDAQGNQDIYVRNLTRRTPMKPMQLTFSPDVDDAPVWSHNSKTIYFGSIREGRRDLWAKNADGSGEERLLYKSEQDKLPLSVSADGKFLLFASVDRRTRSDLWLLLLHGEPRAFVFVNALDEEVQGQISLDSRWIAYVTLKSGAPEVIVRPFPVDASGKSTDGSTWIVAKNALFPRWSPNGKQLVYLTVTGDLMAIDVPTGPVWNPATDPARLITALPPSPWTWTAWTNAFSVHPDGNRILIAQTASSAGTPAPFTLVFNWLQRFEP